MKSPLFFLILFFTIVFINCDNNDDLQNTPQSSTDGFTYNNTFYETANTYIDIDEDDDDPIIGSNGFPDSYTFFFTDGRMFDNDANVNNSRGDYLYSINTTTLVLLKVLANDNSTLVSSFPIVGSTYVVSSVEDSVIIHDGQIDALVPPYFNNSLEFGMGNENTGTFHLPGIIGPTITINAIDLDPTNPNASTIELTYTFRNENGELLAGHYEGTFGVILD